MLDTPRSVREVTDHIRDLFDADPLLGDLWISGEVLESTTSRSGHVFFTLAGEGAQMRCVLFRMNALRQRTLPSPDQLVLPTAASRSTQVTAPISFMSIWSRKPGLDLLRSSSSCCGSSSNPKDSFPKLASAHCRRIHRSLASLPPPPALSGMTFKMSSAAATPSSSSSWPPRRFRAIPLPLC